MKRNEHIFQFTGKEIAKAAQAEFDYHVERIVYWKGEQDKAIALAKASGISVTESQHTGGKSVQVTVDPTVTLRLNECASKITTHQNAADKLQIEASSYNSGVNYKRVYDLHPEDVIYFRLAGGPRIS